MSLATRVNYLVSGATGKYVPFDRVSGFHAFSAAAGEVRLNNAVVAPGTPTVVKSPAGGVTGSLSTGAYHYCAQFVTAQGLGICTPSTNTPAFPQKPDGNAVFGSGTLGAVVTIVTGDMLACDVTVLLPTTTGTGYQGGGSYVPENDAITGINIFRTKVGAPAAGSTPTTAQWFLVATSPMVTGPFTGGSITYHDAIADASLTATVPPLQDLSGSNVLDVTLATGARFDWGWANPIRNSNKGGFWAVEVSGTITGTVEGA